jgi:hypothetical protein
MRWSNVAKIRLSDEAQEVERAIQGGSKREALACLIKAEPVLGRRPEYRYLRHLFDHTFQIRPIEAILADVVELVSDQPDLPEATSLVAELYALSGDESKAELFGRIALASDSASAQQRAQAVLERQNHEPVVSESCPPDARQEDDDQADSSRWGAADVRRSQRVRAAPPPIDPNAPVDAWFDYAKQQLLQRRTPTYGVRSIHSTADMLLDCAHELATKPSAFSATSLSLNRTALEQMDQFVVEMRKGHAAGSALGRSDPNLLHCVAGFLLAVVMHELQGTAVETAPDDGGCKVLVASGAGARPLLIAGAFLEGSGPGLTHAYDRLAASVELATPSLHPPPTSRIRMAQAAPVGTFRRGPSPSGMPATSSNSPSSVPSPAPHATPAPLGAGTASASVSGTQPPARPGSQPAIPSRGAGLGRVLSDPSIMLSARPELGLTRPEVEAGPLRRLEGLFRPGDLPPLDLPAISATLADSPLGDEITTRGGVRLVPTPAGVEALESYLSSTFGRSGSAPDAITREPSDRDEAFILSFGAFLGEAVIAIYGGIWECDPNAPTDPRLFRVMCQDRVGVWPIAQVYLRLKCGSRYDLVEFLANVGRQLDD